MRSGRVEVDLSLLFTDVRSSLSRVVDSKLLNRFYAAAGRELPDC